MNTRSRCRPGCWPQLTRSPKPTQPSLRGGSAEGFRGELRQQLKLCLSLPSLHGLVGQCRILMPLAAIICTPCGLLGQAPPRIGPAPNASTRSYPMIELKSRHLFTLTMKLPPTLELGDTPAGMRRVFTVSGGQFVGDRLRGEVLPQAGSDLLLVRQGGSCQQDVRPILRIEDGALILMTYRGVRHASEDVNARMTRGERVSPSDYYLRTVPFFETSSPKAARWSEL
jgi:Protein of unknown function (DUF3237)